MATVAEVADWIGVSSRRVRELRSEGVLPGGAGDQYDLRECVRAYCSHMRPSAGRAASGGSDGAVSLDQARVEVLNEQRDRLRMLNEQMRGDTVLAEDVESVVGAYADATRAKVLALPTRAAPLVLGLETLAEVRDKLTELAHEACGDLAASEIVSAVHDRARRRAGRSEGRDADLPADGAASEADGQPVGG
nr:hypothetical protein [uncultured Roseococcus sp.]